MEPATGEKVAEGYSGIPRWSSVPPPFLEPGGIHLWRLRLDGLPPAAEAVLSAGERARLARIRDPRARAARRAARLCLRLLLARYLREDPAALELETAPGGKPLLAGGGLRFNLSHADGLGLVAVSRDFDVGVDLERVRPVRRPERIAARMFGAGALEALAGVRGEARLHRFFEQWTLLEARQKCSGAGLFGGRPGKAPAACSFEPAPGFRAALAWQGPEASGPFLRFFQFDPAEV